MRRLIAVLLVAVLAALLGPRFVGPRNHAAGAPFQYEPPEGLVPLPRGSAGDREGAQVWVHEAAEWKNFDGSVTDQKATSTRIILNHSNKEMSVEAADLSKLVEEMPKAFEGSCTWSHRRHEMRVRADGARVGLIEGDCDREIDLSAFGLPSKPVKTRKLQLMFPDDSGTSLVTASYPTDEAAQWAPLLEATIGKAKGVATRVPAPAPWTHAAWALAGAVLGWLGTAIVMRSGSGATTSHAPKARTPKKARADEDDDDDDTKEDER